MACLRGQVNAGHAREMTEIILSPKTRQIIRDRKIRLVSYQDLWKRKFGKPQP